jgi:hypothetical protein
VENPLAPVSNVAVTDAPAAVRDPINLGQHRLPVLVLVLRAQLHDESLLCDCDAPADLAGKQAIYGRPRRLLALSELERAVQQALALVGARMLQRGHGRLGVLAELPHVAKHLVHRAAHRTLKYHCNDCSATKKPWCSVRGPCRGESHTQSPAKSILVRKLQTRCL